MTRSVPAGLRSFMFAPGNHPRKVEKVFQLGADVVILDLEDAVPAPEKTDTRSVAVAALATDSPSRRYIRVNSQDTEWCVDDVAAVVGPRLDGIVLPKVEAPEQLVALDGMIREREHALGLPVGEIDLMPIVETAAGVENATAIAGACERVRRLAFGGGDYTLDLDYQWTPDEDVLAYARARISHASRIANIEPPIDTVVLQIKDDARFRASSARGRKFGFAGKLCIHPSQVPICNEVFTPTAGEVEHARAVIAAFEKAEAEGSASIQLDGYFIDYPIVYKAQRIVSLMERLEAG